MVADSLQRRSQIEEEIKRVQAQAEFSPVPGTVKLKGARKMKVFVRLGNAVGLHFVPNNRVIVAIRD